MIQEDKEELVAGIIIFVIFTLLLLVPWFGLIVARFK